MHVINAITPMVLYRRAIGRVKVYCDQVIAQIRSSTPVERGAQLPFLGY